MRRALAILGSALAGVLATVLPALGAISCSISTTGVSFGTYDVFSTTPVDSTGSVTYRCIGGLASVAISLDKGGAPTFNPRQMRKGSEALNYNLYLDAGRTTIWGDGTSGTQVYTDPVVIPGQNITVTIFGRVPARQDVSAGIYSNTIAAVINF